MCGANVFIREPWKGAAKRGGGSLGEKTSAAPCPRALIDLRMEG